MPDTGEGMTHLRGQVIEDIPGGHYDVWVQSDNGYWQHDKSYNTCDLDGDCYSIKVAPVVTEIDEDESYIAGGNLITIKGMGFSPKWDHNSVMIDGVECEV